MSHSFREQTNWVLPSAPTKFASTLPNYEEALPIRVNREGLTNYFKHRGTLNLGDWATEAKPPPKPLVAQPINYRQNTHDAIPTQVVRSHGVQHYIRSRSAAPNLSFEQNIYEVPAQVSRSVAVQNYTRDYTPNLVYGQNAYEIPAQILGSDGVENDLRSSSSQPNAFEISPQVIGSEAVQNYIKGRGTTSNLMDDNLNTPRKHHRMRVKREGMENYQKNQQSQSKYLMDNYGKLSIPELPAPNTVGEKATNIFYTHQKGLAGSVIHDQRSVPASPRPNPNVIGTQAENNLQKSLGDIDMLHHKHDRPTSTPEPNVVGLQAYTNYDNAQGRHVNRLFHQYGKLPISARVAPKVKYGGVDNLKKAQGDAMRKAISQCPLSYRPIERLQAVPPWS